MVGTSGRACFTQHTPSVYAVEADGKAISICGALCSASLGGVFSGVSAVLRVPVGRAVRVMLDIIIKVSNLGGCKHMKSLLWHETTYFTSVP